MKQEIVFIDKIKDSIVIQNNKITYSATLEDFVTDYGENIPEYIQKLEICKDVEVKKLNGISIKNNTVNVDNAIIYADALLADIQTLYNKKSLREYPIPPNPTEDELELQEKQKELEQKENKLKEINDQLFDLMCEDFANRLQDVQTLPETKEEILSLFKQKDSLMKEIENINQQIDKLEGSLFKYI